MTMNIHKSAEDYLEAMLMLKQERGYVRSIDVADKLGVTKPSVSYATKRLGVSPETARDDACKIEHDLSVESFDAIRAHAQKYR